MFAVIAVIAVMLVSCAGSTPGTPQVEPQSSVTVFVRDTVHNTVIDTLKIRDSILVRETESFKALQKSVDSLIARREPEKAIDLLKKQVQYHNNLDQLGFRTLQLAGLLYQTGHSAEALAILESFAVYKPAINFWIDSANVLYDRIMTANRGGIGDAAGSRSSAVDSAKLETVNSLTAQIRNLKRVNANPLSIIDLADSLRSMAPGDSVLAWLEKQLPSQTESSDSFCEEQRKVAADRFAASRKNKAKADTLLGEAIEALDKCLSKTPSAEMRKKVTQNKEILEKERR
jgi:tetratricopeptide (TPR) repeat protein